MLAKVIPNRPPTSDRPQGFRPRVVYACAKVADMSAIRLLNLCGDWTDAAEVMDFTAALNTRLQTPVCHMVLSWSETEVRSDAETMAAVEAVLEDFGAHGYQAVIALHRDRPCLHVHIILNRVHPITGQALSLSNDYARLERACRRVEHRMGWPADRGCFDIEIVNNEVELRPKPAEHWARKTRERAMGLRPDSKPARAWEIQTGAGYLRDTLAVNLRDFACKIMDYAPDWRSVHTGMAKAGLEYIRARSGARIREIATGRFMQANQLGHKYGFGEMCKKLGAFVPLSGINAIPAGNAPMTPRQQIRVLKRDHARERETVRATLGGARHPGAQALRALMQDADKAAVFALKETLGRPRPRGDPAPFASVAERYRQAIRHRLSGLPDRDDHITRRQDWMLSQFRDDPHMPQIIANLIAPYPDAVRSDGDGSLLFARRQASGGILGFDALTLRSLPPAEMPATSQGGICAIGPHSAGICILVRTPFEAITALLQVDGPPPLVIVTDDTPGADQRTQLLQIVQERKAVISAESVTPAEAWIERMQALFPKAKIWRQEPDSTTGGAIGLDVEPVDGPPSDGPLLM